jgi:hypothetical protein
MDGSDLLFIPNWPVSRAQTQQKAALLAQSAPAVATTANGEEPDAPVENSVKAANPSVESQTKAAWAMLKTALSDPKTQARQTRIDAITAIGTLSDFEQAPELATRRRMRSGSLRAAGGCGSDGRKRRYSFPI